MTEQADKVWTVNTIKDAMRAAGSHWFDPDTMRYFRCRVLEEVYQGPGGIYFVTSEKGPHGPRAYSVRQFTVNKPSIDTVGEFNGMSRAAAIRMAKGMAAKPLGQQWLEAFRALDEAVTGADLGRTFNAAGNYLPLEDAARGQIAYLAGDGGYTRAKATEFSDGSGMHLELIETGATDRKQAWSDAYKLQREACRVLWTWATNSYADAATETAEAFKPVSVLDQFIHDLRKHGGQQAIVAQASQLMAQAKRHHKLMEDYCNGREVYDADGEPKAALRRCRERIESIAKAVGCTGVVFSGDPRGATVKLTFADGTTNDWGKEGYCVPTSND